MNNLFSRVDEKYSWNYIFNFLGQKSQNIFYNLSMIQSGKTDTDTIKVTEVL